MVKIKWLKWISLGYRGLWSQEFCRGKEEAMGFSIFSYFKFKIIHLYLN